MKLKQLFERREQIIPVEVEYEHEYETEDGDIDYTMVTFELNVTVTPDQYGTGDSPTGYDVDIRKAYFKETGKPFDWRKLNKKELNWIEEKAVERALD